MTENIMVVWKVVSITVCAAIVGLVGRTVVRWIPLPDFGSAGLWVIASIVTWLLLAWFLRKANTRKTVALGLLSSAIGGIVLTSLVVLTLMLDERPSNNELGLGAGIVPFTLFGLFFTFPVIFPIGITTAFIMRYIVNIAEKGA